DGVELPAIHKIPDGASFAEPDGSYCRVIRPDGERCRARPTRRFGVCLAHAGGGGWRDGEDARRNRARGNRGKAVLRERRSLLGIGARRSADPRQVARVAALDRADEIAAAMLSPLDDEGLGSMARQTAAVRILDATFPLATLAVAVELPSDEQGVSAM